MNRFARSPLTRSSRRALSSGSGSREGRYRGRFDLVGPDTPRQAGSLGPIEVFLLELFAQRPSTKDLFRRCDHGRDKTWVGDEIIRRRSWRPSRGIGRRRQRRFLGLTVYGNQRGSPSPFRRALVIVRTRRRRFPDDRADHRPPPLSPTRPPRCCVAQMDGRRPPNRASRKCGVIAAITGRRVANLQQNPRTVRVMTPRTKPPRSAVGFGSTVGRNDPKESDVSSTRHRALARIISTADSLS